MLAKLAGDMVRSGGAAAGDAAVLQGLALQREGLGVSVASLTDSWEGLQELQVARAASREEEEQAADEAADKRQDLAFTEPVL
jgi:6-phosphofructokinase